MSYDRARYTVSEVWRLYREMAARCEREERAVRILRNLVKDFENMTPRQYRDGKMLSLRAAKRFLKGSP